MTAKLLGIFGINFIHISIPLFVRRRDNSATTCVTFFLNNSSISDYLFRIQTIIDSLSSLREHVSESDHVDSCIIFLVVYNFLKLMLVK